VEITTGLEEFREIENVPDEIIGSCTIVDDRVSHGCLFNPSILKTPHLEAVSGCD